MPATKPELCKVLHQGAIDVNEAFVREDRNVVAIEVDLRSKYAACVGTTASADNVPGVLLSVTLETLYPTGQPGWTEIAFPKYAGWTVFAATVGRYTLCVCLIKDD